LNTVAETIARAIHQQGVLRFDRFMELALYCPLCGYYEQEADKLGRRGDYYTSVSVGRLFGELLAFQFAKWIKEMCEGNRAQGEPPLRIVEAGAHDGTLARDLLTWLREHEPTLFARLEYCLVEPSPRRQAWQRRTLAEFERKVCWFSSFASLRSDATFPPVTRHSSLVTPEMCGVIFANELLDAMPVRRLGWDANARAWFEWGVALDGERFVWARMAQVPSPSLHPSSAPDLLAVLPDSFTTEVCPAATEWWLEAASVLGRGKLLTLDYGLAAEEFLAPQRRGGTLRAYRQHRVSGDVLGAPGAQDLTAHVNFTAIQAAGEASGLVTDTFSTQAQFLVRIAEQTWRNKEGFGEWNTKRLRQFKTLTHPEHLGRSFRVLVQSRAG
jgi:SAM-dependent MidA family methyltransferase